MAEKQFSDRKKVNKLLEQMGIIDDFFQRIHMDFKSIRKSVSDFHTKSMEIINNSEKSEVYDKQKCIEKLMIELKQFNKDFLKEEKKIQRKLEDAGSHILRSDTTLSNYMEEKSEEYMEKKAFLDEAREFMETGNPPKDLNNEHFISALEFIEQKKKKSEEMKQSEKINNEDSISHSTGQKKYCVHCGAEII